MPRGISWRKLAVLLEYLPPESATMTALRVQRTRAIGDGEIEPDEGPEFDPEDAQWSQLEMLTALVVDEVRNLQAMYIAAHSPKGSRPASPQRVRRPGVTHREAPRSKLTSEQRAALDPRLRASVAERDIESRISAARIAQQRARRD